VVEAVFHARTVLGEIRRLTTLGDEELMAFSKEIGAPYELVKETKALGRMPVVNFAAGGIATPADAALMMQLGVDGVFVGSGIFKSGNPERRAKAIVEATTHFRDPKIIAEVSCNLGEPMVGRSVSSMPENELLAVRGW
jgi:pyridoxal 5'-phosphate synthase pdxS subunit